MEEGTQDWFQTRGLALIESPADVSSSPATSSPAAAEKPPAKRRTAPTQPEGVIISDKNEADED